MTGIDLNQPLQYKHASLRFFEPHEHHVTRFSRDDVLLMVYDGILRFSEDGKEQEVHAGHYYIQRKNCQQAGAIASDSPKYLFVHFDGRWISENATLPYTGTFNYGILEDVIKRMDTACHQNHSYCEQQYLFLKLVLSLQKQVRKDSVAMRMSEYIEQHIGQISSLSDICEVFHYSKNYVIRLFKKEYGVPPFQYINTIRIQRAMYLLETTSRPIEEISQKCGYKNYSYFYKLFVEKTGVTPSKWRKNIQENPLYK